MHPAVSRRDVWLQVQAAATAARSEGCKHQLNQVVVERRDGHRARASCARWWHVHATSSVSVMSAFFRYRASARLSLSTRGFKPTEDAQGRAYLGPIE